MDNIIPYEQDKHAVTEHVSYHIAALGLNYVPYKGRVMGDPYTYIALSKVP